jgi:hypothetical protein
VASSESDSRAILYRFLAQSAEQVEDVTEIIRDNELELVAVLLFAKPQDDPELPQEQVALIFGDGPLDAPEDCAA